MSSNGHHHHRVDCEACDLPTQERLNYFTGQFLTERDFRDEQGYFLGKHRQHNRYLHGWGTVCGLKVVQHPNEECQNRFVVIKPGLALDCCGREIVLKDEVFLDLVKELGGEYDELVNKWDKQKPDQQKQLLISLCAAECETEFVPALYTECGCDETRCEANRIHEGFDVDVQIVDQKAIKKLSGLCQIEPAGAQLLWSKTVNLKGAYRIALDSVSKQLYVLNSADSAQVMVYNANNSCFLKSIDVINPGESQAKGIDLAISPNGDDLYIICQVTYATTGTQKYYLRTINVQNLSKSDIDLASGTEEARIAVASESGWVYVLDLDGAVRIWPGNPDSQSELTPSILPGSDVRSIAVSPNGRWLFIAEGSSKHIRVCQVSGSTPDPIRKIMPPVKIFDYTPELLAISGNSQQLYVVTLETTAAAQSTRKIHAFDIEEAPTPSFPEIKPTGTAVGGAEIKIDTPIALEVSPSGKWAYVLSEDGQGKGQIHVVNGERLRTNPKKAVSDPVAVMANPSDLLLSPDGQRLFAAAEGQDPACGGVSLLDVKETQCEDILWRTLNGCPECTDYSCVPLAAIKVSDWINPDPDKKWQRIIDNEIRPLVPSTNTLKQLILCALEKGSGQQGPEGPRGPKGQDGVSVKSATAEKVDSNKRADAKFDSNTGKIHFKIPKGKTGPAGKGLEENLTQIIELSWGHNSLCTPLKITKIPFEERLVHDTGGPYGIFIEFNRPVKILKLNLKSINLHGVTSEQLVNSFESDLYNNQLVANLLYEEAKIAAKHIFQIFVEISEDGGTDRMPVSHLSCRCPIKGLVFPVEIKRSNNNGAIEGADFNVTRNPNNKDCFYLTAQALAFVFSKEFISAKAHGQNEWIPTELWIRLQGDFVVDVEGRAIDAEYVRADLPTGDREKGGKHGIQGGIFESWCWLGKRPVETC